MSSNTKRVHKIKCVFSVTRNNSRLRYAWYSRHGLEMVKDQILIHTHMHSMEINVNDGVGDCSFTELYQTNNV